MLNGPEGLLASPAEPNGRNRRLVTQKNSLWPSYLGPRPPLREGEKEGEFERYSSSGEASLSEAAV